MRVTKSHIIHNYSWPCLESRKCINLINRFSDIFENWRVIVEVNCAGKCKAFINCNLWLCCQNLICTKHMTYQGQTSEVQNVQFLRGRLTQALKRTCDTFLRLLLTFHLTSKGQQCQTAALLRLFRNSEHASQRSWWWSHWSYCLCLGKEENAFTS